MKRLLMALGLCLAWAAADARADESLLLGGRTMLRSRPTLAAPVAFRSLGGLLDFSALSGGEGGCCGEACDPCCPTKCRRVRCCKPKCCEPKCCEPKCCKPKCCKPKCCKPRCCDPCGDSCCHGDGEALPMDGGAAPSPVNDPPPAPKPASLKTVLLRNLPLAW